MTRMGIANGGDIPCVPRCCQPIPNRRSDPSALDRRFAFGCLAGDQKDHAHSACNRLLKPPIQEGIRGCEIVPMKIDAGIWLDCTTADAPIPAAVERRAGPWWRRSYRSSRRPPRLRLALLRPCRRSWLTLNVKPLVGRPRRPERPYAFDYLRPELTLLRVEPARHSTCAERRRP